MTEGLVSQVVLTAMSLPAASSATEATTIATTVVRRCRIKSPSVSAVDRSTESVVAEAVEAVVETAEVAAANADGDPRTTIATEAAAEATKAAIETATVASALGARFCCHQAHSGYRCDG